MNTKVKFGIAVSIVAALVALIVHDQNVTPPDGAGRPATDVLPVDSAAERLREENDINLIQEAQKKFQQPDGTGIKSPEKESPKEIKPTASEEYVILEGDTYETIAAKKYGSRASASAIAAANPEVKAGALRVGKKIVLPARIEKTVAATANPGGQKLYTVQSGDTLSTISVKLYNTSRHHEKIYDANRDKIKDPHTLIVGAKLVIPELPVKDTVPTAVQLPTPDGSKIHSVQPSESLWKIAEKYAAERSVGILEMMETIVKANPDKLKDQKTLLRLGWQIIIPAE
jgi:nucleoid-associated protein YgaU